MQKYITKLSKQILVRLESYYFISELILIYFFFLAKTQKQLIAQAICLIEKASCVRFLPKNATTDFYVSVQKADKCSTLIGRQPTAGAQIVHLNPKVCFDRVGQIAHEFFHALGFYHEVQRNDRDNYVVLNYQNLIKQSS